MEAEAKASEIASALVDAGLDFNKMDDFIRSEADVAKYLNILEAAKRERMRPIPADSPEGRQITEQLFGKRGEVVDMTGKKLDTSQGIMGGKSVKELMDSGQVTKGTVTKKSKKVQDREMFKAANERLTSDVDSIIKNIKSMEPVTAMKEASSVIGRKGKYKNLTEEQSKKILQDTEDHIFQRDIPEEDFASGGRAGFAGGSDMGTVADSKGNVGPSKGGYQGGGTGPVERPSGGGGNNNTNPKQIVKQTAVNTVKNLGRRKLMDTLGLAKFSNPIGIAMALKNFYDQTQNPTLTEEEAMGGGITGMDIPEYASGGRAGFFMGSRPAVQKGLSTLKEMLKYFGKKSDRVKNPSDILKIVNPKRLNKILEDPNIYRKFDVEKGIAAPDLIKNMQKQMMGDRQKTIEEMLGAAKNIKSADDNIIKYKNEMIEDMLKKGVDREMAEEMAETISKMAKGSAGKFDDTPKLTDEGIMQLENILKDMETGGKTARELNATGGRIGYKDGPKMNRRTFMKYLAGFASLPIIGKIVKPLKTVKGVKNVPIIKTGDVPGKPEWFDALINKVIIEGDDVTKKFATQDRQVVYSKKIDADNEVTVYRDLDTDSVRVDYSSPDVMLDEPVSLSYTRGQADETTKGMKPADEFETFEQGLAARSNGPDDYSIDPEPNVGSSISSLETDVSKLKEYATGKKPTMKEFIASKKRKDRVRKINEGDIGEISDYATKRQGDYYDYEDYASGGIARMLGE